MASTTNPVTIEEMVATKFTDTSPDIMVGQPSLATVWLLVEQLVPVAANITTT